MMENFVKILQRNNRLRKYTFNENGIKTMEILSKILKL